jgi:hypothetical protein
VRSNHLSYRPAMPKESYQYFFPLRITILRCSF